MNSRHRDEYIYSLFNKLLGNRDLYFHRDGLNSDGKKILEKIIREILIKHPYLRRDIYIIRRNPSYENIVKLYELFTRTRCVE